MNLRLFGNVFAFEQVEGYYVLRWHCCDGFLSMLSLTDLNTLKVIVENTLEEYKEIGITNDEEAQNIDRERYNDFMLKESEETHFVPKPQKERKKDHLYILRDSDNNLIKVGRSFNPQSREKAIRTASGNNVFLEAIYPECGYLEEKVHQALKEAGLHIRGEWFRDVLESVEIIDKACNNGAQD